MDNIDTLSKIFEKLDLCRDILLYCSTNKEMRTICNTVEIRAVIYAKLLENARELDKSLQKDIEVYDFYLDQPYLSGQQADVAQIMGIFAENHIPIVRDILARLEKNATLADLSKYCSQIAEITKNHSEEMDKAMWGF